MQSLAYRLILILVLPLAALMLAGCGAEGGEGGAEEDAIALLSVSDGRSGVGQTMLITAKLSDPPAGAQEVSFTLDWRAEAMTLDGVSPVAGVRATVGPAGATGVRVVLEAAEGAALEEGPLATVALQAPGMIVQRRALRVSEAQIIAGGQADDLTTEAGTLAVAFITEPVPLAAFLAGVVALIYWLAQLPALAKFFTYLPPLIWMYFVPMVTTTVGITPDGSVFYSPFMSRVVLPAILILLLIPSDIRGLAKLGTKAVLMMLFATAGIVTGAILSFGLFTLMVPDALPPESWKGIAALAGSWIGGSPNMTAVFESVGTPPGILGPLIVVDTVLAYSWLGILIALSAYQKQLDARHGADREAIEEISLHLEEEREANERAPSVADVAFMVGIALVASQLCLWLGGPVYNLIDGIGTGFTDLVGEVVSGYGWGILLITAAGLLLSTTPVRRLEFCGASSIGYVGLYLLLTTYGARADLRAVLEVPVFFGIGLVWLAIHIGFLYVGMRILRAPLFMAATSSMANIGGTASAPVVAAAYSGPMAPVGLLMAILGGVLGTPLALFVVGIACKAIAGE